MRLEKLINAFVADVCAGKTNETAAAYTSKLQHLKKYLGANYSHWSQTDLDKFRVHLLTRKTKVRGGKEVKGNLSKFTIRTVLATTNHLLKWAGQKGEIPQGMKVQNIKEPIPEPKAIEAGTFEALLSAAQCLGDWQKSRETALLYILRDTGGRVGAIARLELEDLDLKNGYANVIEKGERPGYLWFNQPTIEAIEAWLAARQSLEPKDYRVFTGEKGYGLSREGIYRALTRLAAAAGVTGRHNPHSFRHAFARDALLAGANLGQVSQMMNHSSIVVTHKYYARWKRKELQRFHKRFSPGRHLPRVQGSAKP